MYEMMFERQSKLLKSYNKVENTNEIYFDMKITTSHSPSEQT